VEKELKQSLAYEDGQYAHEYRTWVKVKHQVERGQKHWFVEKNGVEALDAKLAELEFKKDKVAVFYDANGMYTYSGLASSLSERYGEPIERAFDLPERSLVAYAKQPFDSRWYQQEAEDAMAEARHAGVCLPTGSGKSLIITKLCKRFGLPTLVMTPSLSIANQLSHDLETAFGKKWVGRFFAGKKESGKRFVVAVSKSLISLDPKGEKAREIASKLVVICDEAHMTPAETLAKVVLRMMAKAPYRFFLSGTMLRTDGRDLVLEGITGPIVKDVSLKQLVQEDFLARPWFIQYQGMSDKNYSGDPIKMNRIHLHQNDAVYRHTGKLIEKAISMGRRPLVLVEEVTQFTRLLPFLKTECGFAHGGVDTDQKKTLPSQYHKSSPRDLVESFDSGELPILVGTQCIGVGTDIKTADFIVDIVGLSSEIRLSQNIGRGTRTGNGKKSFVYIDWNICNVPVLDRQGQKRRKIMDSIFGPVRLMTP
jgi:superfamily II DNA or RNA helicase